MAEISMKKVALSGILICSMELTNRKKSGMLVDKTENEGCLRNQKFKGGFVMTELQVKTKKGSLKKFFAMFLAVCVCMTTINVSAGLVENKEEGTPEITLGADTMELEVGGTAKTLTVKAERTDTWTEWIVSGDETAEVTKQDGEYVPVADKDQGKPIVSKDQSKKEPVKYSFTTSGTGKVEVAEVEGGYSVKGTAAGNVTITVKAGNTTKACSVTVKNKGGNTTGDKKVPTGVTLDKNTLTLDLNGTKTGTLKATVAPAGADQTVTWQSSDASVATVAANGTVTAVKVGKTTITATVPKTTLKATCAVEVKDSTPAKDNNTNKPNKTVKVKKVVPSAKTVYVVAGKKVTVGATVEPANATNKKITWSTAKKSVASVKAGKNGASVTITAGKKAAGKKTTVTAKASGKSTKVTVNVVKKAKKATSVKLSKKTAKMNTGDKLALTATLNKGATSTIKWSTSNKKVATVANGVVTAGKNAGVVTITAKADKKSAKCVITVTKKGAKVTLNATKKTIKVKKSFTIKLKKKASGDAIKSCTSSNKKVATVTNKGKVTGKKAGKADITVITKKGAVATCKVTVKK